jgi:hypothetical protein
VTLFEISNWIAAHHGEEVGVKANGYPTSWCHQRSEINNVATLILQGILQ